MGVYKRKLADGIFWYYRGQFKKQKYCSKAVYLTKTEAKTAELNYLKTFKVTPKNTLKDVCEQRLDYIQTSKSKDYYRANRDLFRRLIQNFGGNALIGSISRQSIHKYLLGEAERLKKAGKGFYTVNSDLRLIRALFNFSIDELEVLEDNPTRKLKFYSIDQKVKYIPPNQHTQMLLDWLEPEQCRLLTFLMDSGARISEAIRATGGDIDDENGLLKLWTRKKRYSNLSFRFIPLSPRISRLKREGKLFSYTQRPRFLDRACRELGIPLIGFHAYRHLYAIRLALSNTPLALISQYLGHDQATTTQIYLRGLGYSNF